MKAVCTLILFILVRQSECACTFPSSFTGTWVTSGQGTWVVNDTHIQDFKTISDSGSTLSGQTPFTTLTFECHDNRGDSIYVLKSEPFELFVNVDVNVYICMDIEEVSSNKLIFYKATAADVAGDQFIVTFAYTYDDICNDANYKQPYRYRVGLKSGSEASTLIQCPSSIFGSYTYDTCTDAASNTTSMDVCDTRQQLIYNYTLCATPHQMFSLEGTLDCSYYLSSGSTTYLTVYNRDNTSPVSANGYYRFACMALTLSGSNVQMTVYPERCLDNQNSTTIETPGYSVTFTPYFLCPITTDEGESSSTNILPYIIGAVAGLLLIALIILIVCCCLRRRCRKKQEDEESIKEDDDSEEGDSRTGSRAFSRRPSEDSSKSSLDSGIEELKPTPRDDDGEGGGDPDGDDQVKEFIITDEGEKEVDDHTSRPASRRQLSRMSDLPPSTIPPEEEGNVREEPDEGEQQVDNDDTKSTHTEKEEETVVHEGEVEKDNTDENPPAAEQKTDEKPEEDIEQNEDEDSDDENGPKYESEEDQPDEKHDSDKMEADDDKQDTGSTKADDKESVKDNSEPEAEREDIEKEKKEDDIVPQAGPGGRAGQEDGEGSDEEEGGQGRRRRRRRRGGRGGELGSGEDGSGGEFNSSDSEYQRELNRIGLKGGRHYQPTGALTTVLVSREEDEKKRTKLTKTKKQKTKKMNKLARKRTRKLGDKGGKSGGEDGAASSDEEGRLEREGNAAFMEQYRQKKRLEHILDEQHYWSDPEEAKDEFRRNSDVSSLLSTEYDEDEYEIIVDENGVARRIRKYKPVDDDDDYEIIVDADGIERRVRKVKPSDGTEGADDDYEILVGADGIERRVKKTGGNTGVSSDRSDEHAKKKLKSDDNLTNVEHPENADDMDNKDNKTKTGQNYSEHDANVMPVPGANAKLINVKGRQDDDEESSTGKQRRRGGRAGGPGEKEIGEFDDADMDKISDVDSGLSEDEEPVDVILTQDQQQMIVNMLFDEDMNLRPQFDRDEDGRIIRRLDNSVIYDPHTGRFTFLRRLGQLFKVPRLKRNDKGRPTGGYIQDDYGPKEEPKGTGDSGGKRGRVGSGKSSGDRSTASPSADQKRSRTMDGKNVGFDIPDEDMEYMNSDQLEYHKRGRRDIGSAIRRSLNRRLFRKKRKRGGHEVSPLPEVQLQKSWTGDSLSFMHGSGGDTRGQPGPGGTGPLFSRSGRGSFMGTPGQARKSTGTSDIEQLQRNREGLEHDRKILERHFGESDSESSGCSDRPWETRQAFAEAEGGYVEGDESGARQDGEHTEREDSIVYRSHEGRLTIRERNCPDLKHHPQKDQLFTIVRRRRDLEDEEVIREIESHRRRDVHTAPATSQPMSERSNDPTHGHKSDESLDTRASEPGRMSSIDDNRLRRLLEELYKDKKYFDRYINKTEPKSVSIVHSRGLAEHGRGYLLDRADYWERRGPLPPRPPQTSVGWRMQRSQTMWASRESHMNRGSTMTYTPTQESLPGTIESPRGGDQEEEESQSKDDNIKFGDDAVTRDLKESEA